MNTKTDGQLIAELRHGLGLTQGKLAGLWGVSKDTVASVETDRRPARQWMFFWLENWKPE